MHIPIDPEKYAGEGWYATEEYARPHDFSHPYPRIDITREGDYYPTQPLEKIFRRY